jgi:CBS domain-containing protein
MQWHRDLGSRVAKLPFAKVKEGFTSVARHGLGARVWWLDGGPVEVRELLLRELLPIARDGLRQIGVPREDVHRHLGVVEDRVRSGRTASHFLLSTFERLSEDRASAHAAGALVRHMLAEGPLGRPVHHWSEPSTGAESAFAEQTARELMTTRLFTVRPDDVLELATSVMEWRHVRYVPVEDEAGRPLGIVSWKELAAWSSERLRTLQSAPSTPEGGGQERDAASAPTTCVRDVMGGLPPVASPDEPAPELARRLLGSPRGCALIVEGQRLVGIVTEHDVTRAARGMLTERPSP